MSEQDVTRERRRRLLFLIETRPNDPNRHAWEAEYKTLGKTTGKPRNAIDPHCRPPTGYPPVSDGREWSKPEHVNPQATRAKGGRV